MLNRALNRAIFPFINPVVARLYEMSGIETLAPPKPQAEENLYDGSLSSRNRQATQSKSLNC